MNGLRGRTGHELVWGHDLVQLGWSSRFLKIHIQLGWSVFHENLIFSQWVLSSSVYSIVVPPVTTARNPGVFWIPPTLQFAHWHSINSRSWTERNMSTSPFLQLLPQLKSYSCSCWLLWQLLSGLSASSNLHTEVRGVFLRCNDWPCYFLAKIPSGTYCSQELPWIAVPAASALVTPLLCFGYLELLWLYPVW